MSHRCKSKHPQRHTTDPEILARRAETRAAQCEERKIIHAELERRELDKMCSSVITRNERIPSVD